MSKTPKPESRRPALASDWSAPPSLFSPTAFCLFEPDASRGLRLPIRFFFRSLATEDQRQRSVSIILSGMGSDGLPGLPATEEMVGVTPGDASVAASLAGTMDNLHHTQTAPQTERVEHGLAPRSTGKDGPSSAS